MGSPCPPPPPVVFQSTLPVRGATGVYFSTGCNAWISIHAPREGSDQAIKLSQEDLMISIHAPREGSDPKVRCAGYYAVISIHAPREGSDQSCTSACGPRRISIHAPREGSDWMFSTSSSEAGRFQSTLPVRGATGFYRLKQLLLFISIHAPREGSDHIREAAARPGRIFQSTLPVRGATLPLVLRSCSTAYFNPRSP